jgi:glutathione S-transferase
MAKPRLFGTKTSPYVRRVRIVSHELGVEYDWTDVSTDDGQAELRRTNPLWKVPTMVVGPHVLLESREINRYLMSSFGPKDLHQPSADDLDALAFSNVVDGALDALINAFYLRRDGVATDDVAYAQKQVERAANAMAWLESRDDQLAIDRFGLLEIGLMTALDWMRFRDTYAIERHPQLIAVLERWAERPSVRDTAPAT